MNIQKKSLLFSLVASLLLALSSSAEEKIKIGVSTALTGDAATYGVDVKNVLLFANQKLANNAYEFVFEDDKCSGRDAVAVAHRFIDVLKLKYVLGLPCSGALLASAPLYEKEKVVAIAAGASAESISRAGDYIFRTWPSDSLAVGSLYDYVRAKHKVLGALSEETDYAQGFLKSFMALNSGAGVRVESENYLPLERDFRSMLLKLKSKGAEALLLNSQTEASAAAILKELRAMQWNIPIYNGFLAGSPAFIKLVGDLANGIVYPDYPSSQQIFGSDGLNLFDEYQRTYGKLNSVEMIFGTTFESFRAMHQAIKSGSDVRAFLYSTQFKGLFGSWSFDKNGDIQGLKPILMIIRDRKPVPLQ